MELNNFDFLFNKYLEFFMKTKLNKLSGLVFGVLVSTTNPAGAYGLSDINLLEPYLNQYGGTFSDVAAVLSGAQFLSFGTTSGVMTVTDYDSGVNFVNTLRSIDNLNDIRSSINGNYLTRSSTPNHLTCSGSGGSYEVATISEGISCLGLNVQFESFQAANAAYEARQISFYFNRPTTIMQNALNAMHANAHAGKGSGSGDTYKLTDDLGVYFGAGGSFGDVNSQRGRQGFGIDNREVTVGIDYRINDYVSTGFLYNYMSNTAKIGGGAGSFYSDVFRFMPFVSITPMDNAFIDFSVGYGMHDNETSRGCIGCTSQLIGISKADEYIANLNLGYSYNIGALTLTGHAGASGMFLNMTPYSETGANAQFNGLNVRRSYNLSVTNNVGIEAAYSIGTPYGVVIPRVFGEWVHEHNNDAQFVRVDFQGSNIPSVFSTPAPVRDWANVGFGAQMVLPNSISVFTNYQSLIMQGSSNHTIQGGIRMDF